MAYSIRLAKDKDGQAVVNIFNYYIKNSFAAYPDRKTGHDFFVMTKQMSRGYAYYVIEADKKVIGFGFMSPYRSDKVFKRTAYLTYFILPDHTRKGLGKRLLNILIKAARGIGVDNMVVSISSANESSLAFHKKHGFNECGVLKRVGRKFGKDFDVVFMQRFVEAAPGQGEYI